MAKWKGGLKGCKAPTILKNLYGSKNQNQTAAATKRPGKGPSAQMSLFQLSSHQHRPVSNKKTSEQLGITWKPKPRKHTQEAEAGVSLWVQDRPCSQRKFQDSKGCLQRNPLLKKQRKLERRVSVHCLLGKHEFWLPVSLLFVGKQEWWHALGIPPLARQPSADYRVSLSMPPA